MDFLASELDLSIVELESLLVDMIMDERISAQIDQIGGILELTKNGPHPGASSGTVSNKEPKSVHKALGDWAEALKISSESLANREF